MVEARKLLFPPDLAEEVGRRAGYGEAGYFVRTLRPFRPFRVSAPLGWRRAGRP